MAIVQDEVVITIIGAGLAGSEAAWQLAHADCSRFRVRLIDMKPSRRTEAQVSDHFAELVCSNSLRSRQQNNAVGLLKEEMRRLGSLVIEVAEAHQVPAGDALAVNRELFSAEVSARLRAHPRIDVIQREVHELPPPEDGPCIVATGPLTDCGLAENIACVTGQDRLYFYDAIAPIIAGDSLPVGEDSPIFAASRWDKGEGQDYLNCPLNKEQYLALIEHMRTADVLPHKAFEAPKYFCGCQPVEVIAQSGVDALRFGPLKPVGLTDPKTGRWPYAAVQLRCEDKGRQAFNLVGFQTRQKHGAQKQMLQMIPGLQNVQVLRFGAMHRNTFVDAAQVLDDELRLHRRPHVRLAGQITGVEGYVESAACGLILARLMSPSATVVREPPPDTCALGALYGHLRGRTRIEGRPHEPQNINWGLFAPIPHARRNKAEQKVKRVAFAHQSFEAWAMQQGFDLLPRRDESMQRGSSAKSPSERSSFASAS